MKMTDEQKNSQPLLEHGIILMPKNVYHEDYINLSWALLLARKSYQDKPLELACYGEGGGINSAFAIYDLVKRDGNIDGIAIGDVSSAHSIVWAACNRRFVYPNSAVSIHQVKNGVWQQGYYEHDYELAGERFRWCNLRVAELYADISNEDKSYWHQQIMSAHAQVAYFDAEKLVELGMASYISERD